MKLDFITKGNHNIRGKSKIYFCGHPADYESKLEEIAKDVLEMPDCTVWYDKEPEADADEEQYFSNLSEMHLFVIPITPHFLYKENRAFSKELPFAVEKHIPILPIMEDNSLEHIFEEKCGNLQALKKSVRGPEAVSYKERLKNYLQQILIGSEWIQEIPRAFAAKIFLAYRKDDRKFAHRFMEIIHEDIRFRNVAVWYDEFLEIGNDYSKEIDDSISASNVFAMIVTPNILASGSYNYVKEREYPFAVSLGKPIMPVAFMEVDGMALKREYKGIPDCIGIDNKSGLYHALETAFDGIEPMQSSDFPEQQFLLGLAYLGGIGLERNAVYAEQLITSAAESGMPQAIERMVTMQYYGEAVTRNLSAAIRWQNRLVQFYQKEYGKNGTRESGIHTVFELHKLYGYFVESGNDLKAMEISFRMKRLSSELRKKHPRDYSAIECLVISLSDVADAMRRQGDVKEAKKILQGLKILNKMLARDTGLPDADEDLLINYQRLGSLSEDKHDFKSALKYYQQALRISEKMKSNNGSDIFYRQWLDSLLRTGICLQESGACQQAEQYLQKCLEGYRSLSGTESNLWNVYYALSSVSCHKFELNQAMSYCNQCIWLAKQEKGLQGKRNSADSYARRADILKGGKRFNDAETNYLLALNLMEALLKETGACEDKKRLWSTYGMLGDCYFETGRIKDAKKYYQASLHTICQLHKNNITWQTRWELAQGYQRMGMVAFREEKPMLAMEYFTKSLANIKKAEAVSFSTERLWMKKLVRRQIKECRARI